MKKDLWQACLICEDKCCSDFAIPLYLTPEEKKKHLNLNTKCPCVFFSGGLCEIYSSRPFDCRFAPFDIMAKDKKFYWIVRDVNCPIVKNKNDNLEKYLDDHERHLIPKFIDYLAEYARFREEEMDKKFKYKILREVKV